MPDTDTTLTEPRTDDRTIEDVLRALVRHSYRSPHTVTTDGKKYDVPEQAKWLASELGYHVGHRGDSDGHLVIDIAADERYPGILRNIRNEWGLRALDLAGMPEADVDRVRAALGLKPRDREWDRSCDEHDERNRRVHEEWGRMVPAIYRADVSGQVKAVLASLLRVRQAIAGSGSWSGAWTVDLEAAAVVQQFDPAHRLLVTVLGPAEVRSPDITDGDQIQLTGILVDLVLHGTPEHPWCKGGLFLPSGAALSVEIPPEAYAAAPPLLAGARFTLTGVLRKAGTPPRLTVTKVGRLEDAAASEGVPA